jgi:hypothetical protein
MLHPLVHDARTGQMSPEPHGELEVFGERHGHLAICGRAHACQVPGAIIGIVCDDEGAQHEVALPPSLVSRTGASSLDGFEVGGYQSATAIVPQGRGEVPTTNTGPWRPNGLISSNKIRCGSTKHKVQNKSGYPHHPWSRRYSPCVRLMKFNIRAPWSSRMFVDLVGA